MMETTHLRTARGRRCRAGWARRSPPLQARAANEPAHHGVQDAVQETWRAGEGGQGGSGPTDHREALNFRSGHEGRRLRAGVGGCRMLLCTEETVLPAVLTTTGL